MFDSLQDLLGPYYERLFPSQAMYAWLSYGSDSYFSRREFSFMLSGDVYIRYQSFGGEEEFTKELRRRAPEKIDIGAVYNHKPKNRESFMGFQPMEKEFVVDIDLTDYDDVRSCCSGAKVCENCWKFLAIAVDILDASLKNDFGFKHLLWVYSGRRGVHCWVCDKRARVMSNQSRAAVIEYLSVIKGGENQAKKVKIPYPDSIHPLLSRSVKIIEQKFDEIVDGDQKMFQNEKNFNILPPEVKAAVKSADTAHQDIMNYIKDNKKEKKTLQCLYPELLLQFCYPRLDVNVSKGLNHLLKSPFCIHPKTGQVCVPFDARKVSEFKTAHVPNVAQLMDEIASFDKEERKVEFEYQKTSIREYVEFFQNFVSKLPKIKQDLI